MAIQEWSLTTESMKSFNIIHDINVRWKASYICSFTEYCLFGISRPGECVAHICKGGYILFHYTHISLRWRTMS